MRDLTLLAEFSAAQLRMSNYVNYIIKAVIEQKIYLLIANSRSLESGLVTLRLNLVIC